MSTEASVNTWITEWHTLPCWCRVRYATDQDGPVVFIKRASYRPKCLLMHSMGEV